MPSFPHKPEIMTEPWSPQLNGQWKITSRKSPPWILFPEAWNITPKSERTGEFMKWGLQIAMILPNHSDSLGNYAIMLLHFGLVFPPAHYWAEFGRNNRPNFGNPGHTGAFQRGTPEWRMWYELKGMLQQYIGPFRNLKVMEYIVFIALVLFQVWRRESTTGRKSEWKTKKRQIEEWERWV